MADDQNDDKKELSPQRRLFYVRQRIKELRDELTRLTEERRTLQEQVGSSDKEEGGEGGE
jgi:hypothetical protein